jgi:hypothetical protein
MPRNRSVYAPRREPVQVDWTKQLEESDRARAEEARVQQAALDNAAEFHHPTDPLMQLVERLYALEQRVEALESKGTPCPTS